MVRPRHDHVGVRRERLVDGQAHLTLTGWDRDDYSVLQARPQTVVLQMANADVTDEKAPQLIAETLKVQKEFNWCVDRLTYEKYGTKDPSKPGVYWMTPQEASAMTNAVGNASTQYVKTKVPADARAWVDTFAKESRELSKQNPAGSSWIEKIDCSKYASKIQIK